ncbi:MAG: HNH endonuclease, partial [Ruminococcus flavefaciens]|nr:HNH endonuclease [Ruminococcus flavefaciens]
RGERLARKRLAKKLGTTMKAVLERVLPGCKEPVRIKDIINTETRFSNRKRPEGWLTPTATQLLRTHLNLVRLVSKVLPVSRIVLELNRFDFAKLENPNIQKWEYGRGPLHGYDGVHAAVHDIQGGQCLVCGDRIEYYHHIILKKDSGSERIPNIVGLCAKCFHEVLQDKDADERLMDLKQGAYRKYAALSVLNQIIPGLASQLADMFPGRTFITDGRETKKFRNAHSIAKDHGTDAYCIACSTLGEITPDVHGTMHMIRQFRRHDRARINAQTERTYYLDGVKVATNRRKRADQKADALDDWLQYMEGLHGKRFAQAACSRLIVKKSRRRYNNLKRMLPGTVFMYGGKRYVMQGQQTNGTRLHAYGSDEIFPAKKVTVLARNSGLVYV